MKNIALPLKTFGMILAAFFLMISPYADALTLPAYSYLGVGFACAKQVLESSVAGDRVTVIFSDRQGENCMGSYWVDTPSLPPGAYTLTARSVAGVAVAGTPLSFTIDAAPPTLSVFALFHQPTNTFFITASPTDRSALFAQGWETADTGFTVWPANGPSPPTTKPVCRFFVPAKSTHFYSGNAADCAALKSVPGFVDEGIVFRALMPTGGVCALGAKPVYRLFDSARANHRSTTSTGTASAMVTSYVNQNFNELPQIPSTWINEGIAFCSPIQ